MQIMHGIIIESEMYELNTDRNFHSYQVFHVILAFIAYAFW